VSELLHCPGEGRSLKLEEHATNRLHEERIQVEAWRGDADPVHPRKQWLYPSRCMACPMPSVVTLEVDQDMGCYCCCFLLLLLFFTSIMTIPIQAIVCLDYI